MLLLYEFFMMIVIKNGEKDHIHEEPSGGNTNLEETLKAILSSQKDMKEKMQNLSR